MFRCRFLSNISPSAALVNATRFCATTTTTKEAAAGGTPVSTYEPARRVAEPKTSEAWRELAATLLAKETVSVEGAHYNQSECLQRSLQFNPKDHLSWYALGCALLAETPSTLAGGARPRGPHTPQGCFQQAVAIDPDFAPAWMAMGSLLGDHDIVLVHERPISKMNCFERAILLDDGNTLAWMCLGDCLENRPEKKVDTLTEMKNENKLGSRGKESGSGAAMQGGVVDSSTRGAMGLPPGLEGDDVGDDVSPGVATPPASEKKSDAPSSSSSSSSGSSSSSSSDNNRPCHDGSDNNFSTLNGKQYDALACYQKVLEIDPARFPAWNNAGRVLAKQLQALQKEQREQKSLPAGVVDKSKQQSHTDKYFDVLSTQDVSITVGGKKYNALDCFMKTLEIEPVHSFVWWNVARTMALLQVQTVQMFGHEWDPDQVAHEAKNLESFEMSQRQSVRAEVRDPRKYDPRNERGRSGGHFGASDPKNNSMYF